MSVVVTGATGFLGLHLVRELLARNTKLTVVARPGSPPTVPRIKRFLAHSGTPEHEVRLLAQRIEVVDGDVTRARLGLAEPDFRAITDQIEAVWHCAADIAFASPNPAVHRRNVSGMRGVLELMDAADGDAVLCHASTLAVAGRQREGVVPESWLDGAIGFNSPYEESKFVCELMIRDWCTRQGRTALVFRLPGLITDAPAYPGRPAHPLGAGTEALRTVLRTMPDMVDSSGVLRVPGTWPDARVNLLPVEHVAYVMVESLERTAGPVGAYVQNIAHSQGIPAPVVLDAVLRQLDRRIDLVLDPAPPVTPEEQDLQQAIGGFLPLLASSRRYELTRTTTLGITRTVDGELDGAYILRALEGFAGRPPAAGRP
jgi:thioester reductase-like protein